MSNDITRLLEEENLTHFQDDFHPGVIEFTSEEYRYWVRENKVTFRKLGQPEIIPSTSISVSKYKHSHGKHLEIITEISRILREAEYIKNIEVGR